MKSLMVILLGTSGNEATNVLAFKAVSIKYK